MGKKKIAPGKADEPCSVQRLRVEQKHDDDE
jgi:hypothetical protein